MPNTVKALTAAVLALAALLGGCAGMGEAKPAKERVVLQVSDGNPATWNQALNVVENMKASYAKRGVDSEIQIVAFGQGIQMLKDDAVVTNRVRDSMKGGAQMVACENSMGRFKLTKDVMVGGITYSETGVIYIIEKQRQGWAVIRP
jgi:intracellular sulfur oxidation DsrE/DsrF family protein